MRSILGQFWVNSGSITDPYLRNLMKRSVIAFIWPWVGPLALNIWNYGSWDGLVGTRYSPPSHPPGPHHPGYTSLAPGMAARWLHAVYTMRNMVVGLISVVQLTLSAQISGSSLMTEVYNLVGIGRINDHKPIPGTD